MRRAEVSASPYGDLATMSSPMSDDSAIHHWIVGSSVWDTVTDSTPIRSAESSNGRWSRVPASLVSVTACSDR